MPASDVFAAGSTALVTGGASGIGLAVAKLCRAKGMKVLLVDRNSAALRQAEQDVSGADGSFAVVSIVADVSQEDDWRAIKDKAVSAFGTIELLVLNAGTGSRGTWGDSDYFRTVRNFHFPGEGVCRAKRAAIDADVDRVDARDKHLWRRERSQRPAARGA